MIDDIIYDMNYTAINACGNLSLGGLAAVLSSSTFSYWCRYWSIAFGKGSWCYNYWFLLGTKLINWGPLTRGNHHPMISWKMDCPLCGIVPNDPYPFEPRNRTANILFHL